MEVLICLGEKFRDFLEQKGGKISSYIFIMSYYALYPSIK